MLVGPEENLPVVPRSSSGFGARFCLFSANRSMLPPPSLLLTLLTDRPLHASRIPCHSITKGSAQLVENPPAMQETPAPFLGWEDPLEKRMATLSSTLAWRIPWRKEPGGLQPMGSQRVGHD